MLQISLKARLSLIMLFLSAVATGSFLLMAQASHKALTGGKEELVRASIESIMDKIDRNLFERYGDVQAFSQSEPARAMDRAHIEAFMTDMMAAYAPIYDAMIVTDAKGNVIAVNTVDKNAKPAKLNYLLGKNLSDTKWFKAAISDQVKPGTAFVEDPQVDKELGAALGTDGRVMTFTSPIRKGDKIVGVWSNRMSWADVVGVLVKEETQKMRSDRISEIGVTLIDKGGRYLLNSSDPNTELKDQREDAETVRGLAAKTSYVHRVQGAKEQIEVVNLSKGYSSYPGQGWEATITVPLSDPAIAFNIQLVWATLAFLLLVNIGSYWFAHSTGRSFESLVRSLFGESVKLKGLATSVQHSSQSLAAATSEQGAAVEQTVASTEEMRAMLGQTSQQAAHCHEVAESGQRESRSGKAVVAKLAGAMDEIQSSNARLDGMVKLINEIKEKTNVINEIVSETRLLSFNASIEGARAGAQGKGFAVVAEEVGKLAAMSGKAAEDIAKLLDSSTKEVNDAVKTTQERIRQSKEISEECEAAFTKMGQSLEQIESSVRLIVSATKEQEEGINQTNAAMSEMDRTTQSNSRGAETLAAHSASLTAGAATLDSSLQQLSRLVFAEVISADAPAGAVAAGPAILSPVPKAAEEKREAKTATAAPTAPTARPAGRSDSRWRRSA